MKITVGIATANRQKYLDQCLSSLEKNTYKPDAVIVVENSLGKESNLIIRKHKTKLPILRIFEKKIGTPHVRNVILSNAQTEILAFVDDDTILPKKYIENILDLHKKNPKIIAIQGKSESLPQNSFFAKLIHLEYLDWIEKKTIGKYIDIIDTKNASFKLPALKKIHFEFDPIFARFNKGEDVDLAMFLSSKKIKILFSSKIVNFHQENTNLLNIIRRRVDAGRARWYLENKWGGKRLYLKKIKKPATQVLNNLFIYIMIVSILKLPYYFGYLIENFIHRMNGILIKITQLKRDSD